MKTPSIWTFLAVMAVGVVSVPGTVHAQGAETPPEVPAEAPAVTGGEDKPWNQGVPVESRRAARALFLEGNRLFRVPLFAQAARKYEAALRMWKHPAFYFNLALAQLNLDQAVAARDNLEQAVQHGAEPLGSEQFTAAEQQLHEVQSQLAQIQVSCATPGAEVALDGVVLFTGPGHQKVWAKAQAHEVTAKKPNYLSEARRVVVAAGDFRGIELALITLDEATHTYRRWATWKPWAVFGAGVAIAGAGGVLHALSAKNVRDYDARFVELPCVTSPDPQAPGCARDQIPADLRAQLDRADRQQRIAVGGYVVGGSLLVAGGVLLYLNRQQVTERAERASVHAIQVIPAISPDAIGVLISVSR